MDLKLKKGKMVRLSLHGYGMSSYEHYTILRVTKGKAWLDNGPGNDPTGPFDAKSGKYIGDTVPGFSKELLPLE